MPIATMMANAIRWSRGSSRQASRSSSRSSKREMRELDNEWGGSVDPPQVMRSAPAAAPDATPTIDMSRTAPRHVGRGVTIGRVYCTIYCMSRPIITLPARLLVAALLLPLTAHGQDPDRVRGAVRAYQ